MNDFLRAVRLTFRYRATVAVTVGCSLLIAVLWGGNIGAIYPILEVSFSGKSMPQWADAQIAKAEETTADLRAELAELEGQAAGADDSAAATRLELLNARIAAEEKAAAWLRFFRPYLARLPSDPFQMVLLMVGVVVVGTILKDACIVAHTYFLSRLTGRVTLDLQQQFFDHALRMDQASFGEKGVSVMMSRMGADIGSVAAGVTSLFGNTIREPLKMLVCLTFAAGVSWRLLLFSLVLAPVAALLVHRLAGSIRRAVKRSLDAGVEMNRAVYEAFFGLPMVQSYTMEEEEKRHFADMALHAYHKSMRIAFYNSLVKPLTEVLGIAVVCVALASGAYLVLNQQTHLLGIRMSDRPLEWPQLLVFYGFLIGLSDPARRLSDIYSTLQRGVAGAERLYEILDQPSQITDPADPKPLPSRINRVELGGVDFRYATGDTVLRGVDLTLKHDEAVAIVGPNGCGKSTLANLLPRFYDPVAGGVKIDGVDLRDCSLKDLRDRIAIVSQQSMLFDGTVESNIRYGTPGATDAQVEEAARRAHADAFIRQLPEGYRSPVGPGGTRLSGGQRQRIILARAILRDPQILILDEATNQIDPESEHLIHQSLKRMLRGRLTVMITHRLSTLDLADRIVVMADGRIVDAGTHDQLHSRCTEFRRLVLSEFRESA